jgi:2-polyprenyl-6-methoxyphenol hydroxylase-like FAD-dependent oxidoreductase
MSKIGGHGIVIGASIGGLLAARAIADKYDHVTVVERDELPCEAQPRKGVPQGRHAHGLLAKGREILEQLFPGFTEDMVRQGAVAGDLLKDGLWFNHGSYLRCAPSGLDGLAISRPALEAGVRNRLSKFPNVHFREHCAVREPVFDPAGGRVTGVIVADGAEKSETLNADLVIDASGCGSHGPAWLQAMGFAAPTVDEVRIDVGYMTRLYRRKPEHLAGKRFVIMAACDPDWRFGALLPQEHDRWIVTLGGYLGDRAPADDVGYVEFARSLRKPEIYQVLADAEPLTKPTPYGFSASRRRHYEKLTRFPEGLLVFGDALCSFNPVYGQGMTVACLEALALGDCLEAGADGIARRFFAKASRVVDTPWQIAVGSDLQHPRVVGKRTPLVRFTNWYISKLYSAAETDPVLAQTFLKVANLTREPDRLLRPEIVGRVWVGNRSREVLAAA